MQDHLKTNPGEYFCSARKTALTRVSMKSTVKAVNLRTFGLFKANYWRCGVKSGLTFSVRFHA